MEEPWLTQDDLLASAKAKGFDVTARQLERWRKAGVLPRPRRLFQGRGRGTRSEYPPETASQLLDLCRLHFGHGPERRLDELSLALWWQGYPTPLPMLKKTLHRLLKPLLNLKKGLKRRGGDALDRAEKASQQIQSASARRVRGTWLIRRANRNLRTPEDAHSFLAALLQMFLGELPPFQGTGIEDETGELTLGQIVERGVGLAGRTAHIKDSKPWLAGAPGEDFEDVVYPFLKTPCAKLLESASEHELVQAREDVRSLSRVGHIAALIKKTSGTDVFGASVASNVLQKNTPIVRTMLLLFLIWLRKNRKGRDIDHVKSVFEEHSIRYDVMRALLDENPHFARYLHPRKGEAALQSASPEDQQKLREALSRLLVEHPEWQPLFLSVAHREPGTAQ